MSFFKVIGAAFLFLIFRQLLKLINGVNQRQMPPFNSQNNSTQRKSDVNVIEASFTRKE